MTDLYLVFIAGLLGSAHCIGMCGGFVLAIGSSSDRTTGVMHQGFYFAGKTVTYTLLGAIAGAFGSALLMLSGFQNLLSIAAGVLMLLIGLGLIGVLDRFVGVARLAHLPAYQRALGYFLQRRTAGGTMGLGLLNGLLPCGLVYGLLVKAAATGTLLGGALTMFVFGIATIPALFVLGFTGHLVRPVWRNRLNLAGGVLVVLLGVMTIVRGTPAMDALMARLHGGGHSPTHEMHRAAPPHPGAHSMH